MKNIVFIVEKTDTGYSAFVDDEKASVATVGNTMGELKQNMVDAYNLYQEAIEGKAITIDDLSIKFDIPQFFEYYKPVLIAKGLAQRAGMNETLLNQYVNGGKKPSEKQAKRILKGIRDLGAEWLDFA